MSQGVGAGAGSFFLFTFFCVSLLKTTSTVYTWKASVKASISHEVASTALLAKGVRPQKRKWPRENVQWSTTLAGVGCGTVGFTVHAEARVIIYLTCAECNLNLGNACHSLVCYACCTASSKPGSNLVQMRVNISANSKKNDISQNNEKMRNDGIPSNFIII